MAKGLEKIKLYSSIKKDLSHWTLSQEPAIHCSTVVDREVPDAEIAFIRGQGLPDHVAQHLIIDGKGKNTTSFALLIIIDYINIFNYVNHDLF